MPQRYVVVWAAADDNESPDLPLQYFKPQGYQPMHISSLQKHGAQRPLTSLQRDDNVLGKCSVAASKLEIDEPFAITNNN